MLIPFAGSRPPSGNRRPQGLRRFCFPGIHSTIAREIRELRRSQERLIYLAEHDDLTGLLNRRRFEREMHDAFTRVERYGEQTTLLLLDLDGLKRINDTHGHQAGDTAIKAVADTLRERLRQSDVIARIGGDEFAVLLPYTAEHQANAIADDLQQTLSSRRLTLADGSILKPSASVGSATVLPTKTIGAILEEADQALYDHKRYQR